MWLDLPLPLPLPQPYPYLNLLSPKILYFFLFFLVYIYYAIFSCNFLFVIYLITRAEGAES